MPGPGCIICTPPPQANRALTKPVARGWCVPQAKQACRAQGYAGLCAKASLQDHSACARHPPRGLPHPLILSQGVALLILKGIAAPSLFISQGIAPLSLLGDCPTPLLISQNIAQPSLNIYIPRDCPTLPFNITRDEPSSLYI